MAEIRIQSNPIEVLIILSGLNYIHLKVSSLKVSGLEDGQPGPPDLLEFWSKEKVLTKTSLIEVYKDVDWVKSLTQALQKLDENR